MTLTTTFPVFFLWLQVSLIHSNHHNDNQGALFPFHLWTFPVVMKGQHWLKREHTSWMPWHTGRGQSKMEKKKPCPRLLDYLVVVGARWELNLTLRSKRNVSVNMVVISKQILLWKTNCIDATWGRQSSICRTCWKKSYPWGITINRTWLWPNKAWTQDLWGCSPGFDTRFFESCGSWDVFTSLPTWCSIHNEA